MPGVNEVFGGRPVEIWQFMTPGIAFGALLLAWEESRKCCIRLARHFAFKKGLRRNWWDIHVRW